MWQGKTKQTRHKWLTFNQRLSRDTKNNATWKMSRTNILMDNEIASHFPDVLRNSQWSVTNAFDTEPSYLTVALDIIQILLTVPVNLQLSKEKSPIQSVRQITVFSLILSMTGKINFQTSKAILLLVKFSRIPRNLIGIKRYYRQ